MPQFHSRSSGGRDDVASLMEEHAPDIVSVSSPATPFPLDAPPATSPITEQLSRDTTPTFQCKPLTTERLVLVPGSRKRVKSAQASTRRLNPRLRYGIVCGAILLVMITTVLSLSPLDSAQGSFPLFSGVVQWAQTQQQYWSIVTHLIQGDTAPPAPLPAFLSTNQYVAIARQDAINVGIPPDYFVRQIYLESGFNPNAGSPAGAVGIAQFLPSTAASLGVDPRNPISALNGAAHLMGSYYSHYGGDYAKALAAYNAGGGTVDRAVSSCGSAWLSCVPPETRGYVRIIMGG